MRTATSELCDLRFSTQSEDVRFVWPNELKASETWYCEQADGGAERGDRNFLGFLMTAVVKPNRHEEYCEYSVTKLNSMPQWQR